MRALYLPNFPELGQVSINGEAHHHLVNVIRANLGSELLLLDGKGRKANAVIKNISKKDLTLQILNSSIHERKFQLDLALGLPKKEALELCLRQAVEIGFNKIFLVESTYSNLRNISIDRLEKITISALEQSNSPFLPVIENVSWKDIQFEKYIQSILLNSQETGFEEKQLIYGSSKLLIVGPEGGFDKAEMDLFKNISNLASINLPTGILRTPTAVSVGAGWLLERLMD